MAAQLQRALFILIKKKEHWITLRKKGYAI